MILKMNTCHTNKPLTTDTPDDLRRAVNLFFECRLTEAEELRLRRAIAASESTDPLILEAKAVMGFSTLKSRRHKAVAPRLIRFGSVAAALAVVVTLCVHLFSTGTAAGSSECIAYHNGVRVTDEATVMSILADNLTEINLGAQECNSLFIEDIDDLAPLTLSDI